MVSLSSVRNIDRMRHITEIAVRHGFGYFFERHNLRNLLPLRRGPARPGRAIRAVHIRRMLEEMGPTFIKFGQLLSTRPDVVPADILVELRKLQDEVTPFPVAEAQKTIEAELGLKIEQLFLEFDDVPIAAASIGQVHRAVLPNGAEVIVKVQRPDAEAQIRADMDLLYQFAHMLSDYSRQELLLDPIGLVDQFSRSLKSELDYRIEARNCQRFGEIFDSDPYIVIPKVYWQYSTSRVLTLEYIPGIQIVDIDLEVLSMAERKSLATLVAECWLKQIFVHGFFHGDPHPANILMLENGAIALVDFGIAGRLTAEDRQNVINLFLDVTGEKIENIPKRLAALGVAFPKEKEEEFVIELRDLFAKYFGAHLEDLDPVAVFRDIFGTIYRLKLKLPPEYLLLDKTVATLEGITTQIYPSFNVLEFARPYAHSFIRRRLQPHVLAQQGQRELSTVASILWNFPYQLRDALDLVRNGEVRVNFVHQNLDEFGYRLTLMTNRLVVAIVLSAIILGSSIIGLFAQGPRLLGISIFALAGFIISAFFGMWLVIAIVRSRGH